MKKLILGVCSIVGLSLCSQIAYADPVLQARIAGSTFVVDANNSENIGYNCNVIYTLEFLDFGKYGTEFFKTTTHVVPNAKGTVVNHQTGKAATGLGIVSFNSSCFKASQQTTQAPSQSLPGGTYSESCYSCSMNGSLLSCRCDGHDTTINVAKCGNAGRNLICNNNGNLSCPGPC